MYESEQGNISIAAGGDCIISRRISMFREQKFLELVNLMHQSDVVYTNLEQQIRRREGYPVEKTAHIAAAPEILEELKWMGINMVSCANNHAYDYGEGGVLSTIKYLEDAGLTHAGIGYNLAEARAPGYLETAKGRVALLSMATPASTPGESGAQRPSLDFEGRPGISMLHLKDTYFVDHQAFSELQRLNSLLGFEAKREERWQRMGIFSREPEKDSDKELNFLTAKFIKSDNFAVSCVADKGDTEDILRWVSEARRQADWVILSIHSHEVITPMEKPPEFLVTFAHASVDAGVDVFISHGPHMFRGMEIYQGKPIFYGLGNFICQLETLDKLPASEYSAWELGHSATPADVHDSRGQSGAHGLFADTAFWESVLAINKFKSGKLEQVELHPLAIGFGKARPAKGRPLLAGKELAEKILNRLCILSKPFGTDITITDGIGIVRT